MKFGDYVQNWTQKLEQENVPQFIIDSTMWNQAIWAALNDAYVSELPPAERFWLRQTIEA